MAGFYYWAKQLWMVWVAVLFVGIVVWTLWPSRKPEMERHARIPLEDQEMGHAHED